MGFLSYKYTSSALIFRAAIVIALFLGFFLIMVSPFNLGVTPDSIAYLQVGNNVAKGLGLVFDDGAKINHWAPGYPLVLGAASAISGLGALAIGKYVNLILLLLLAITFFKLLLSLKLTYNLSLATLVIFLCSTPILEFKYFLSEPLFTTLLTIVLLLFFKWTKTKSNIYLIAAGILSGLFLITRYAGLGLIAGFNIVILFVNTSPFKTKLKQLLSYNVFIGLILLLWLLYSYAPDSQGVFNRALEFHPISLRKLVNFLLVIIGWFTVNENSPFVIFNVLLLAVITVYVINIIYKNRNLFKNYLTQNYNNEIRMLLILIASYALFLIVSISFFDAYTPIDNRILSVIAPMVFLVLAIIVKFLLEQGKTFCNRVLMLGILVCVSITSSHGWYGHYKTGFGFNSRPFLAIKSVMNSMPETKLTYTNGNDVFKFYTNKSSKALPIKPEYGTNKDGKNYDEAVAEMKALVDSSKAQILYFSLINRVYLTSEEELIKLFGSSNVQRFDNGFLISKD